MSRIKQWHVTNHKAVVINCVHGHVLHVVLNLFTFDITNILRVSYKDKTNLQKFPNYPKPENSRCQTLKCYFRTPAVNWWYLYLFLHAAQFNAWNVNVDRELSSSRQETHPKKTWYVRVYKTTRVCRHQWASEWQVKWLDLWPLSCCCQPGLQMPATAMASAVHVGIFCHEKLWALYTHFRAPLPPPHTHKDPTAHLQDTLPPVSVPS